MHTLPVLGCDISFDELDASGLACREPFLSPTAAGSWLGDVGHPGLASLRPGLHSAASFGG